MLDDIALYLTVSPLMAGTLLVLFVVRWLRGQPNGDSGAVAQSSPPEPGLRRLNRVH